MVPPNSVVVYRAGALGDLIVTFPVLHMLREAWPHAKIALAAPQEVGNLAVVSGWADRLLSAEAAWVGGWFAGNAAILHDALGDADALLAFTRDEDGELERTARAAGISQVVMWPPLPREDRYIHVTDYLLGALEVWGVSVRKVASAGVVSPLIRTTPEMIAAGRAVVAGAGIEPGAPYVVVHTGSSSVRRNWPEMPRLVGLLKERTSLAVVLQRGPVEVERGDTGAWPNGVPLVGPLSLATLAGLIAGAAAYVGNNTGPSQLAAALGVPAVTVFGRRPSGGTDAPQWAPRGPRAVSVAPVGAAEWPTMEATFEALIHLMRS